jgi:hypothetical protein
VKLDGAAGDVTTRSAWNRVGRGVRRSRGGAVSYNTNSCNSGKLELLQISFILLKTRTALCTSSTAALRGTDASPTATKKVVHQPALTAVRKQTHSTMKTSTIPLSPVLLISCCHS